MSSCERWLTQSPPRTAAQMLGAAAAALRDAEQVDRYGEGEIVSAFEAQVAQELGKEAALLLPSGRMAQVIALRIHCDGRGTSSVAFHPTCHLEIVERPATRTCTT
jgi:threonine aldolase